MRARMARCVLELQLGVGRARGAGKYYWRRGAVAALAAAVDGRMRARHPAPPLSRHLLPHPMGAYSGLGYSLTKGVDLSFGPGGPSPTWMIY